MKSFLGVQILIGGTPFGNLYLTEKADGQEFSQADEQALTVLAQFAGVAIDHALSPRYRLCRVALTFDARRLALSRD